MTDETGNEVIEERGLPRETAVFWGSIVSYTGPDFNEALRRINQISAGGSRDARKRDRDDFYKWAYGDIGHWIGACRVLFRPDFKRNAEQDKVSKRLTSLDDLGEKWLREKFSSPEVAMVEPWQFTALALFCADGFD